MGDNAALIRYRGFIEVQKPHENLFVLTGGGGNQEVQAIITGHSTTMSVAELQEYAQFNKAFLAAVQEGNEGRPIRR